MYIYEHEGWPQFTWDTKKINELLATLRHEQGRLMGGMKAIGFDFQEEAFLQTLTQDVVKTSEIEGEILDPTLARSSVARHLGIEIKALDKIDKQIEGVVEMTIDATEEFKNPITKERLFIWHKKLFPTGRSGWKKIETGNWRKGSVQVISGNPDKEIIHFEAPPPEKVDSEMVRFMNWVNQEGAIDFVLKAAIAHLWFLTIHPFDDGNGRIGRAIADLLLTRSENSSQRFYSLSAQIQKERKAYYAILEKTQKGGLDITSWIEWFLNCLQRAIDAALKTLNTVIEKRGIWNLLKDIPLNERQRKVLSRLIDGFEGNLTTSKWAKIAKCSQDTAHRDILDLIEKRILGKNEKGGRSTSYSLQSNLNRDGFLSRKC